MLSAVTVVSFSALILCRTRSKQDPSSSLLSCLVKVSATSALSDWSLLSPHLTGSPRSIIFFFFPFLFWQNFTGRENGKNRIKTSPYILHPDLWLLINILPRFLCPYLCPSLIVGVCACTHTDFFPQLSRVSQQHLIQLVTVPSWNTSFPYGLWGPMLLPHSPFHEFLLLLLRELSGTQPWDLIPQVISFGSEISFYPCSLDCFPHPRLSFCLHQMFHAQNWGPDFTFPDPASSPGLPCINGTFWSRCQNPSSYAPFFSVSSHTVHQPDSWLCLQRIVCFHWSVAELGHVFFLLHCILLFPCPDSCFPETSSDHGAPLATGLSSHFE